MYSGLEETMVNAMREILTISNELKCTLRMAAFVSAIRGGAPVLTPPPSALANMRVIDDVYRAAGLEPRRGSTG